MTNVEDQIQKLAAYERAGVREVWLVHPTDHVVIVYTLSADGDYGKPAIHETRGTLAPGPFPDLAIEWDLAFPVATAP